MLLVACPLLTDCPPSCPSLHAGVGSGDRLIDIGSGDGRFCVAAAQQAGVAAALGLELDPGLVAKSRAAAAACDVGPPQVQFLEVRLQSEGSTHTDL